MTFKEWLENAFQPMATATQFPTNTSNTSNTVANVQGQQRVTQTVNQILPLMGANVQKAWGQPTFQSQFWGEIQAKNYQVAEPDVKQILTKLSTKAAGTLQPKNQVIPPGQQNTTPVPPTMA